MQSGFRVTTARFTVENIFAVLRTIASNWRDLGEILSLKEDILDEISINNNTNEACLQQMIKFYMMRSDLQHDWQEISNALLKIGEETLADVISHVSLGEQQQNISSHTQSDEISQTSSIELVPRISESTDGYRGQADIVINLCNSVKVEGT